MLAITIVTVGLWAGTVTNVYGQGYSGLGVDFSGFGGGSGEGSVFPIRIKLRGTLNPTTLQKDSTKVATLAINGYHETYQFEITQAESVDDKQIPRRAIIPRITFNSYDYRIFGNRDLLSKIGQAVPNTPLTIIGFLRQRKSELIIESIETIHADGRPSLSGGAGGIPPALMSSEDLQPE
ncbi:MAG: hypothetical protein FJ147_01140 [Deltaproteobacteria bacterium]|nr:hypothetical protein [Deltaproteobacteria bacterium]